MSVILLYLLGLITALIVLKQGLSRKVEFFSIRNLYLAGFVVYHVIGPAKAISTGDFSGFRINDPKNTALWLTIYVYVFFFVYLFAYHKINIARWFASKASGMPSEASDSMLMALSVGLIAVGLPLRFFGHYLPVVGPAMTNVSFALAGLACASAGWVWSQRKFNPAVISVAGAVLVGSLVICLYSIFGRRPLIGVLFGFAWGAYYRWARYVVPSRLILYMIPLLAGATIIIGAYTAIRRESSSTADVQALFRAMMQADVKEGSAAAASGQGCAGAMMWALEQYPVFLKPKPLFSLQYMALYFVPRQIWPNKPEPLSQDVATLAKLKGVNRAKITIPPGVIGYAAAEGGMYALIIYALFFGQFTRFFDELVRQNPFNPFIILPAGCVTGQFLGLARGDIGSFTAIIIVAFVSTMALMFIVKLFFGKQSMPQYQYAQWPQTRDGY
ncbi:hypothetical protein [Bythopirellula goksoeyrii]|uniref:Uncharacterized protein n=1 Tax=Bythopirellula goksoeyrii TaxID=1400387 RepID=A0A5B9Q6T0_9BACT|nr:hypothetical protein [Bythopirellula goksoeyrii]QEG34697.1 hypothetical protein Pr1d_19790 [Bythopirellula goksoeyrii]